MRRRAEFPGKGFFNTAAGRLEGLMVVTSFVVSIGCAGHPTLPPLPAPSPTQIEADRGRRFPNLVLIQDSEKGFEFWVRLEVGLDSTNITPTQLARIQTILLSPASQGSTAELEGLIGPAIDKAARPAFRQIV